MIALVAASAIYMLATQAAVSAATVTFKDCLKQSSAKAKSEKVAPDAYETYVRNACSAQLNGLNSALVSFDMKNGMSKKASVEDAEMVVSDYVASSVDKYRFFASVENPTPPAAKPAPATPPATPAAAPQPKQ